MSRTARNSLAVAIALACLCAFARTSRAEDDAWMTDFDAAKAKAKEEKKLLLVDFTGSDWCIWCKRLHGEVFEKDAFKTDAPNKFVLVELDFPREKKLPDELKAQNQKLAKQYKIRGYPTVLLLNPDGEVVAHTGYRPGGAEKYVENLSKLLKLHGEIIEMETQVAKTEGLGRAKLLDRLVDAMTELNGESNKIEPWAKEIIALDTDNRAGLKGKYEVRQLMSEVAKLMQTRKFDEAKETIEKVLATPGLTGPQKQDAYATEATLAQIKMDRPACLEALNKAVEAAPESPKAEQLKSNIARIETTIKNEEAATKLQGELANAEGQDRLKLLDKTLTAYAKVNNHIDGKDQSADVAKWMDEIVKLDADNKAGLKAKYEFQIYYNEAQRLFVTRKTEDALAAIEKALALPDLKPAQISRATLLKCNCFLAQKKFEEAIDCAKAAQGNAKGMEAAIFPFIIKQAQKALEKQKAGDDSVVVAPIQPTPGGMLPLATPPQRVQRAAGDSAASEKDPFKVPNGSIEELFKYVDKLKKRENAALDEHMDERSKAATAIIEATDKILAAGPTDEQRSKALKLKLEAFGSMPFTPGNKLIGMQKELIEQLKSAEMPKEAQQATRMLLSCKLQLASGHGAEDLEKIIDEVKDYYRSRAVDATAIGLARDAGRTAEYSGSNEMAVKTYRELGKILAEQKDPKVVDMAGKLVGASRRLGLKDNTMRVEGTTLDGKPLDWSKYAGKVVLIDFWATWCGPCRAEMPNVRKNYEAYHDRGFEVIGVSLDQKREDLDKFMEKEKLPWTIVTDDSWNKEKSAPGNGEKLVPNQLANYYGVFGIPTLILLGKDGKAISLNARGDALTRELEKAFGPVVAKAKDEENK